MVSDKQKRSLEYFKNKIVTFFVPSINRNFDEKQSVDYFVGKVVSLDDAGIWYEHPINKCMNFIFYERIISISEEQIVEGQEVGEASDVSEVQELEVFQDDQKIEHLENAEQLDQIKIAKLPSNVGDFRKLVSGS